MSSRGKQEAADFPKLNWQKKQIRNWIPSFDGKARRMSFLYWQKLCSCVSIIYAVLVIKNILSYKLDSVLRRKGEKGVIPAQAETLIMRQHHLCCFSNKKHIVI
ncbi:MAG: hypothetical protein FJ041_06040 [Candidatus Cloacimonetes bacterium]|nr:hypothetical protein [Candidatus Cloacimonadota bacterium]